jgi:hypothetical protein
MRTRFPRACLAVLAIALAGCRGDAKPPPRPAQTFPSAPGRLTVALALPQQPGWNHEDSIAVTIANASAAPVPDATLSLLVQAPVAVLADSAGPAPRPTVTATQAATRVAFPLGTLAVGQTVTLKQAIRTPAAPAPAAATPAPAKRGRAPAQPDTSTRFLVRAELVGADGSQLAAPAEDTLRIRAESAVVLGGCGNVNDVVVTRYGVGPVRVGMPVDALRAACPEARDTAWQQEGTKMTGLVAMPGGRRVVAVTAGNAVDRIVVDQTGLQTAAGAGVGASVSDLRARFGRMCAGTAERPVAVWFPNAPGLSFGLDTTATKGWTPAQVNPDSVPDGVKVTSFWVRKGSDDCPARPGEGGQ